MAEPLLNRPNPDSRAELAAICGKLAGGYLLIHLNINLGPIDILPDWLGFYWMAAALPRLAAWQPSALLIRPLALFLTVWNGAEWAAAICGLELSALPLLPLVVQVVSLYFHYQLLTNLADAAEPYLPEHCARLRRLRDAQTVFLTAFSLLAPWLQADTLGESLPGVLSLLLLAASVVVAFALWGRLRSLKRGLLEPEAE